MPNNHIKILIDTDIPYIKGILEPFAEVRYKNGRQINAKDVIDIDILVVRTRTNCNKALLDNSSVTYILTATIGTDHIDLDYCQKAGIEVFNAKGCNAGSVVQYVLNALAGYCQVHNKKITELTLGIVGVGDIGGRLKAIAQQLGMKTICSDPPRERKEKLGDEFQSIEYLQRNADIITLHVPLIKSGPDKTFHYFDEAFFNSLPKPIGIINSSRGEVINNLALRSAILQKKINYSVLDVWENEPYVNTDLLNIVDIGTPHIAGYSADGKANATSMCVQSIAAKCHFPLLSWYPDHLPKLQTDTIYLPKGLDWNAASLLSYLLPKTYAIAEDHRLLVKAPDKFEELRSRYKPRREPGFYRVILSAKQSNLKDTVTGLGFQVEIR